LLIWDFINITNKYIVENEPWTLGKNPANEEKLTSIMYNLLVALRSIAILLMPFMPQTAEKILRQIGADQSERLDMASINKEDALNAGSSLIRGESLFPRVNQKKDSSQTSVEKVPAINLKPDIDYEEFAKIDLRAGEILAAEAVPKSNKLIKLKVDIGEERTIVAGIAKDYTPTELIGKK